MSGARRRVGAVVLAAGGSSRFGSPKQLHTVGGQPLVRRAALAALDSGAAPVLVVLGAHADQVTPALDGLEVSIAMNDEWQRGLASSLATGVRALVADPACDGVLVMLADQPLVDAAALSRLLAAFDGGHRLVASAYGGALGVPAVFGREYVDELLTLEGDSGAGPWLRARGDDVTCVPLAAAALDVDTPLDAAALHLS